MSTARLLRPVALAALTLTLVAAGRAQSGTSFVITGAQVADGTGAALRAVSVRVEGDTITAVGALTPGPADRVIDGRGLVLAPGFIDTHNHSTDGIEGDPAAETQVSQGITTVALGQDGSSPWPIADYLARRRASPPAVNIVMLAGHATIRRRVMGDDYKRTATRDEIARMRALVDQAMREGAFGLSSGLEYEVGSYAGAEELVEMAAAAGAARRLLHLAHSRRGRPHDRGHHRGHRDRRAREAARADHAHQAGHRRRVGQGPRGHRDHRGRAPPRRGRHRRRVSLPRVAGGPRRCSCPTSATTIPRA